jgi:hypothetical protein
MKLHLRGGLNGLEAGAQQNPIVLIKLLRYIYMNATTHDWTGADLSLV